LMVLLYSRTVKQNPMAGTSIRMSQVKQVLRTLSQGPIGALSGNQVNPKPQSNDTPY